MRCCLLFLIIIALVIITVPNNQLDGQNSNTGWAGAGVGKGVLVALGTDGGVSMGITVPVLVIRVAGMTDSVPVIETNSSFTRA